MASLEDKAKDRITRLNDLGQSVWVDMLHRGTIASGQAARYVELGVSGFTSNPTSLEVGLKETDAYDDELTGFSDDSDPEQIFETLVTSDIQDAADILRLTHETSKGSDGFVSIEVRPEFAHDTDATVRDAKNWLKLIDRPNVMVKVPGTPEGMSAIRQLTADGVNVNVTLLFAREAYRNAANAYIDGLRDHVQSGQGQLDGINSVASFFISRVDALVDELIDEKVNETSALGIQELKGKIGIANARLAYKDFDEIFSDTRFTASESLDARKQRPLWASTSVKDPAYPETMYVEALLGPHTVNTMPANTFETFISENTEPVETVTRDTGPALKQVQELEAGGISLTEVTDQLLAEGIQKFSDSYKSALKTIEEKISQVGAR